MADDQPTTREKAASTPLEVEVGHAEANGGGTFFHERDGVRLASMTYARISPTLVVVDHTEVSPKLRGLGVGRHLLDGLVAWARQTGTKIAATCPYVTAQFEKDPSLRDVRHV